MSEPGQAILRKRKMRGGLGRTLLTAFLLLAIGPLSAMSVYAIDRTKRESRQQQEQQVLLLAESYRAQLALALEHVEEALQRDDASIQWHFDKDGNLLPSRGSVEPLPEWLDGSAPIGRLQVGGTPAALWVAVARSDGWAATLLPLEPILNKVRLPDSLASSSVYFQQGELIVPLSDTTTPLPASVTELLENGGGPGSLVRGPGGQRVDLPVATATLGDNLDLVIVRPEEEMRAVTDSLAAALVATALLAALLTTVAAAMITRRITQPLYELTKTAVEIAQGDLTQRATVRQDNELGILALAFNIMTTRLQETLETLEERVDHRTEELSEANAKIRARARQLEMVAEIGAMVGNIHELDTLLEQATRLAASAFGYRRVSIWLLGRRTGRNPSLTLRAYGAPEGGALASDSDGQAGEQALAREALESGGGIFGQESRVLAVPLRVADKRLGSMVLTHSDTLEEGDKQYLQILADTIAVAIENARASEMERVALEKLNRLEHRRTEFLGEMSVELTTALNSIIGFSHLMLKEIEGPLTDMQRSDLTFINRNGTHLLSILDKMLDGMDNGQLQDESISPTGDNDA